MGPPGRIVKTGMRAFFAVLITEFKADTTVLSPGTHNAWAPREASELAASRTPDELSTCASKSWISNSCAAVRACPTNPTEFDSAGFQATPTVLRRGNN